MTISVESPENKSIFDANQRVKPETSDPFSRAKPPPKSNILTKTATTASIIKSDFGKRELHAILKTLSNIPIPKKVNN